MEIGIVRANAVNAYNNVNISNTWWSSIVPFSSNEHNIANRFLDPDNTRANRVSCFDLEKVKICVDISRHAASLIQLTSLRHFNTVGNINGLHINIVEIIDSFNHCSNLAVLSFIKNPPVHPASVEHLRSSILSTALQTCEDLIEIIFIYFSSNAVQSRKNLSYKNQVLAMNVSRYPSNATANYSVIEPEVMETGVRIYNRYQAIKSQIN
jgi:hypothetical protein